MTKSIRIDVDGHLGLEYGVPNMLDLLEKHDLKASFYLTIGRSSNFFDYLKFRLKTLPKIFLNKTVDKEVDVAIGGRYTFFEKLSFLKSRDLGKEYENVIKRIIDEGHEASLHCYNHLEWSKNFKNLDLEKEFEKMISAFKKVTGKKPKGFVSPEFKFNKKTLLLMDAQGFTHGGDMKGKKPFHPIVNGKKLKHVQIPLSFSSSPEELFMKGYTHKQVLDVFKKEVNKDYSNLYFHADWEGMNGLHVFNKILSFYNTSITHEKLVKKLS